LFIWVVINTANTCKLMQVFIYKHKLLFCEDNKMSKFFVALYNQNMGQEDGVEPSVFFAAGEILLLAEGLHQFEYKSRTSMLNFVETRERMEAQQFIFSRLSTDIYSFNKCNVESKYDWFFDDEQRKEKNFAIKRMEILVPVNVVTSYSVTALLNTKKTEIKFKVA